MAVDKEKSKANASKDVDAKINEILVEGASNAVKMEVDYSEQLAKELPTWWQLARNNELEQALDKALVLEKSARAGGDASSNSKILVAIVQMCKENEKWELLNEQLLSLSKKRSQLKMAITKMVQECCKWIQEQQLPSEAIELKLIETLRTLSEGKIFVETERARLTHRLAQIQENSDKDIVAAAKTMLELQIETYGSMERKEKVELILEQMRLCLANKDYIRTQIISKKINVKFFEKPEYHELKRRFYDYMIEHDQQEGDYLSICKHYRAIYDTPVVQENEKERLNILRRVAAYVVLSPFEREQSDLIQRIKLDKRLEETPLYKALLDQFTRSELIDQRLFAKVYEKALREGDAATKDEPTDVFDAKTEEGTRRWNELKKRVVEHNIRILAKYYTKIKLDRMAQLLDLSVVESEDFLSSMVVKGTVHAKTDRLEGVVCFQKTQKANDLLNEWSFNISKLMELVQKTDHLIHKEEMVHKHLHK